jgi:hypothetical protein
VPISSVPGAVEAIFSMAFDVARRRGGVELRQHLDQFGWRIH